MRKNLNKETITGRLFDHTLEAKVSQKGVPYIGGVLEIAVDEEGLNVIPVTLYRINACIFQSLPVKIICRNQPADLIIYLLQLFFVNLHFLSDSSHSCLIGNKNRLHEITT